MATDGRTSHALTTHERWDWRDALGAVVYFLGGSRRFVVCSVFDDEHVDIGPRHLNAGSHRGDSLTLDLSEPSTHGVFLGILWDNGEAPPPMRTADECAESYGERLATRITADWEG